VQQSVDEARATERRGAPFYAFGNCTRCADDSSLTRGSKNAPRKNRIPRQVRCVYLIIRRESCAARQRLARLPIVYGLQVTRRIRVP